jgi:hypothetical protein
MENDALFRLFTFDVKEEPGTTKPIKNCDVGFLASVDAKGANVGNDGRGNSRWVGGQGAFTKWPSKFCRELGTNIRYSIVAFDATLMVFLSFKGQVAYFKFCRGVLVEQADRTHLDAVNKHKEAREFAEWASKEREERRAARPPLTEEQREQVKEYLQLMNEHPFKQDPRTK